MIGQLILRRLLLLKLVAGGPQLTSGLVGKKGVGSNYRQLRGYSYHIFLVIGSDPFLSDLRDFGEALLERLCRRDFGLRIIHISSNLDIWM